jgi:hypothetical protein
MQRWFALAVLGAAAVQPAAPQARILPFVAEQTVTDYATHVETTRILAGRSDGARVTVVSVVPGQLGYQVENPAYTRELVLADGEAIRLVDAVKAKSTWARIPEAEMAGILNGLSSPAADCGLPGPGAKVIGHDIVEGMEALIVQETASNGRKTMAWMVPALGCAVLRATVQMAPPNGPAMLVSETRLIHFSAKEPDARLFYAGGEYAEMKPSRALDLQQAALHLPVSDRGGVLLDRKYASR